MNLASRCRQAISTVELLQKELASYQKNTNGFEKRKPVKNNKPDTLESNTPQPIKNNTITTPPSLSSSSSSSIMNVKSASASASAFTPQDNSKESVLPTSTSLSSSSSANKVKTKSKQIPTSNKSNKIVPKDNNYKENDVSNILNDDNSIHHHNTKPTKDNTSLSSRKRNHNKNNKVVQESDVAFGELHSQDFFNGISYENTLPVTPEKENLDLDDQFQKFSLGEKVKENGSNEDNSYDAFEASFQTTFPSSFQTQSSSADRNFSLEEVFSDSDPFFFTESTPMVKSKSQGRRSKNDVSPPPSRSSTGNTLTSSSSSSNKIKDRIIPEMSSSSSSSASDVNTVPDDELDLFPASFGPTGGSSNMNMNQQLESTVQQAPLSVPVATPPKKGSTNNPKDRENLQPPSPPSEKQNGGAAARARYKYALSDPDENAAPMDEAQADIIDRSETSPSLVLQRLHQRKVKDKTNGTSISSSSVAESERKGNINRSSLNDEIRKLDEIANGPHGGTASGSKVLKSTSRRRAVKQPISYAEPSLNSKLRRGDVFFPKHDVAEAETKT
jgi:hypothetical protein